MLGRCRAGHVEAGHVGQGGGLFTGFRSSSFLYSKYTKPGPSCRSPCVRGCSECPLFPRLSLRSLPRKRRNSDTWPPPTTWSGSVENSHNRREESCVTRNTPSSPLLVYLSKICGKIFASCVPGRPQCAERPVPGFLRFPEARSGKSGVKSETGERESNKTQRPDILCYSGEKKKKTPNSSLSRPLKLQTALGKEFLKQYLDGRELMPRCNSPQTPTGRLSPANGFGYVILRGKQAGSQEEKARWPRSPVEARL